MKELLAKFFYKTKLIPLERKVVLVFKYQTFFTYSAHTPEFKTFCEKATKSKFMKKYDINSEFMAFYNRTIDINSKFFVTRKEKTNGSKSKRKSNVSTISAVPMDS